MKHFFILFLLKSVAGLMLNTARDAPDHLDGGLYGISTEMHNEYVEVSKSEAVYHEHKSLSSTFMFGREGSNKCLSFMHIPKNGGTTMEDLNNFNGGVLSATHGSLRHWGRFDSSLHCTFHRCQFSALNKRTGKTTRGQCSKWHVPPHVDSRLAASYTADGCETFCITRSPSEKMFSQMKYNQKGTCPCTMKWFHAAAVKLAEQTPATPYFQDCHMVPQTEYIYGNSDTPQFCMHRLSMENLKVEFANLMSDFDIPLSLSYDHNPGKGQMSFASRDADPVAHNFIQTYYADDLKNFNYTA